MFKRKMKNTGFDYGFSNTIQAKNNNGGLNKMNKNLLLCGLFLIGIFLMSGSASAATINATWYINPSFGNVTLQNTTYAGNTSFRVEVCAEGMTSNDSIDQVNITLPTDVAYINVSANGTDDTATVVWDGGQILSWTNSTGGLLNYTSHNCTNFWFNATIGVVNPTKTIVFEVNATNESTTILNNLTAFPVVNVDFDRAIFTSPSTIDVYFTNNLSFVNYSKFVCNKSSGWVTLDGRVDSMDPRIVHLRVFNLSSSIQLAGSTANLNISTDAINASAADFDLLEVRNGRKIARSLISNFYTKNLSSGQRYGYGADTAETNRSLVKNLQQNITLRLNTGAFTLTVGSYKFKGKVGTWNETLGCQSLTLTSLSDIPVSTSILAAGNLSANSSDYTVALYVYNTTDCTGSDYQIAEFNLWEEIYTIDTDLSSMTVGGTKTITVYIKNQTARTDLYLNLSGVAFGSSDYNRQVVDTGASVYLAPEYSGNITLKTVADSTGNLLGAGKLPDERKIYVGTKFDSLTSNIGVNSQPSAIYKNFETNLTINITGLNESGVISGFDNYKGRVIYNLTLTAGKTNVSRQNWANISINGTIAVFLSFSNLSNFNTTGVSGTVDMDVNILIDVNNDSIWDYNTTKTSAASAANAADLVFLSVTPTSKNLSAGAKQNVILVVRNQTNQLVQANVTLMSTSTRFYNGTSYSTSITTITNDSNGVMVFTIIPEQAGTITATVSRGSLTSTTENFTVYGCQVDRESVSPTLGTRLVFNQSYTFSIPVRKRGGGLDYAAIINVSSGKGFSGTNTVGSNISGAGDYVTYSFTIKPNVTGYLNITILGQNRDGDNATFLDAYNVKYEDVYTINVSSAGNAVTELIAGLNNTVFITTYYTSNYSLVRSDLTITYYNDSHTVGGDEYVEREVGGNVTNVTRITTTVPNYATVALLEVTNETEQEYGDIELTVRAPTVTLSTALLIVNATTTITKANPSCIVPINDTITNLTFIVDAPYTNSTIILKRQNNSNLRLGNGTGGTSINVQLTKNHTSYLLNWTPYLNATQLFLIINNSNTPGWNLMNISLCEPTVTLTKSAVPVDLNTTLDITVTAYGQGVPGLVVNVSNNTGRVTLDNETTDADGKVTVTVGPAASGNLRIWLNNIRSTTYIIATKTLDVDYSPTAPNIYDPLVLYVRPYGSTTEVVENSYLNIQAPGSGDYILYAATDGTYAISSPSAGVYVVYAVKTAWTDSAIEYINVVTTSSTTSSTSTTTTTTTTTTTLAVANVVINEFVCDPTGADAGNEWAELHNAGGSAQDLTNWTLDGQALSGSLAATGFLQVIFTAQNLNNDGDTIVLSDASAVQQDSVAYGTASSPVITAPGEGQSAGENPDGSDSWEIFATPTPGASNVPSTTTTTTTTTTTLPGAGDINGDGTVDLLDLATMGQAWGSFTGDANWNANADLVIDGTIDLLDLATLGQNWGNTY